eukprot:g3822.t1
MKNSAFVFVKPHADNEKTRSFVRKTLQEKGLRIVKEGAINADEIDQKQYIDQHYYAIASKATILKPAQLSVPADQFEKFFGIGWKEALDAGKVFNAKDACAELKCDANELNKLWAAAKKNDKLIKFGGGFYCGEIKKGMYVFNGFFMTMRAAYVAPGCSIYYFVVQWDEAALSWKDFRAKVLGPTDPAVAPADSVRGLIFNKWRELGLKAEPNVGDNGVHASASPFEALAERCNWLGVSIADDAFGKQLLAAGISADTVKEWSVDPQVLVPATKKASLFDSLEDTDSSVCLAKAVSINAVKQGAPVTAGAKPGADKTASRQAVVLPVLVVGAVALAAGYLLGQRKKL